MAMPKGFKSNNGYATTSELGGKSYHEIAKAMTEMGFKMNHSTARNVCVDGLKKIAKHVSAMHGVSVNAVDIIRIAKDPRFQAGVSEIMKEHTEIDL